MARVTIGSKERLRKYFLENVGRVLGHEELRKASGDASEWGRRVRELRDEEGYQILTHRDRSDLKPGEYLLETAKRVPAFARGMSKELRARVLERNGSTCQMCGVAAGDKDPFRAGRTVRLTIGHRVDKSKGGTDTLGNLFAQCTNCNEGLQNTSLPHPNRIELLKAIRRGTTADQKVVLEWLGRKFKDDE